MAHLHRLENVAGRVYLPGLRREYNEGLYRKAKILRFLPYALTATAIVFSRGWEIVCDPVIGVLTAYVVELVIESRSIRLRQKLQAALSNKYQVDLRDLAMVGVSPGSDEVDYEGDPSWDIGFLGLSSQGICYLGDICSFILDAALIDDVKINDHRNLVTVYWVKSSKQRPQLSLSIRHAPHSRIRRARKLLYTALLSFVGTRGRYGEDERFSWPPVRRGAEIVCPSRTESEEINPDKIRHDQMSAWARARLPELIWTCPCGEVNIRSHLNCRLCRYPQPPRMILIAATEEAPTSSVEAV